MIERYTVNLEFECVDLLNLASSPFDQWRLGIQENRGVKHDVPCSSNTVLFKFLLGVALGAKGVTFRGGYAQGPRGKQFVYLCWGERVGGVWENFRRAKVPLYTLGREQIEAAIQQDKPIRARIKTVNAQGEPVAATLKSDYVQWL